MSAKAQKWREAICKCEDCYSRHSLKGSGSLLMAAEDQIGIANLAETHVVEERQRQAAARRTKERDHCAATQR